MKTAHKVGVVPIFPLLLTAAMAVVGASPPILAQPPAKPTTSAPFTETLRVNVVNVEVFVTDKKGNPITDLGPGDFELREDGDPVTITNFFAVQGGRPALPPGASAAAKPDAGKKADQPAARKPPLPEDQRLHLVILIDNTNIRPFNRNRVLRELNRFVTFDLEPHTRMMVATYDRGLHLRQAFTEDPKLITATLLEQEKHTGEQVHQDSERKDVIHNCIDEMDSAASAIPCVEQYAEGVRHDVTSTVDSIRELISNLAGLPGRKALLYVSDGLPRLAGEELFYAIQKKFGDSTALTRATSYDISRSFEELSAHANANRVTLYTLDARGLVVASSASAEVEPGQSAGIGAYIDSIRNSNLQSPLQLMAETTGGRAMINTNRFLPDLDRMGNDFGNYYSLGYTPAHSGDGRYHRIDVRVKRKGVVVRHRQGYRDKTPDTQMSDATLAALHVPYQHNPLGVDLEFEGGKRRDDNLYDVALRVRIPVAKLTLIPHGGANEGQVRLWIVVMDDHGGISPVQQVPVPLRFTPEAMKKSQGHYISVPVNLTMRPGLQRLAVGVRDELTAETTVLTRQVSVGSDSASSP